MKIFFPTYPTNRDGIFSYITDLANVLKFRGHRVDFVDQNYDHYDIVFTKEMKFEKPIGKYILHLHNAIVPNLWKETIPGFVNRTGAIVTCNSQYQMDSLEIETFWLPNCIDEVNFFPNKKKRKSRSILYVGRISSNNRNTIKTLIEAMKRLPDYTLTLAGSVEDDMKSLVSDHKCVGNKSSDELFDLMNTHSIGIGVGRSAMEMILCGLPVLLFGLGFEGWITEENVKWLHRESNITTRCHTELSIEEKVEKICSAILEPVRLDRNLAIDEFGLRSNIRKYEDLFKHENI